MRAVEADLCHAHTAFLSLLSPLSTFRVFGDAPKEKPHKAARLYGVIV